MRSITAWLLLASVHQEPVPSQVTAAGSCAQVTRPGRIPRGTPNGESVGSNKEEPRALVAAIERANCRRVISIVDCFSVYRSRVSSAVVNGSKNRMSAHSGAPPRSLWGCEANRYGPWPRFLQIYRAFPFSGFAPQMISRQSRRIFQFVLEIMLEPPRLVCRGVVARQ